MLKPPISRMGGKSQLRKTIIGMIPEHQCYTELFFGAGWVYFGKEPSKVEVVNDIDGELINLFRMIKYHSEEIERLMNYEVSSRDEFMYYKQTEPKSMTEVQRAVRFIYLISQSFASKGEHYGYGVTGRPAPHIFDTSSLEDIKKRLRNTYIENLSFEKIIEKYDRTNTFHFCDPPYYETDGYASEFGEAEQKKLSNILHTIKGKFLLTINDHPEVRKWYEGFTMREIEVTYSVSRSIAARRGYKELIITNY